MILHLFNIDRFANDCLIDHKNGDVESIYIKSSKNMPNQMKIKINSSFSRFNDILIYKDFGIRFQDGNHDQLFIFKSRELVDKHQVELEMLSYSYKLGATNLYNIGRSLSNYSLGTFLADLDEEFTFTPIGSDVTIDIATGASDNLALLTESVNYKDFFEWVDAGLTTVGSDLNPTIVYGNFKNIETYYNTSGDERFAPLDLSNVTSTDNIYSNKIFLENAVKRDGGRNYSLIFPYVNNGTGYSDSTSVKLTSTTASYIDPQFPVVEITSPVTNEIFYCIRNPFVPADDTMKVYEYEIASNIQDQAGNFTTDIDISEEMLYNRAVSYVQSMKSNAIIDIQPTFKSFVLAGTKAKVQYLNKIKKYDGSLIYTQDFSGDYILDDIELDINSFAS